MNDAVITGFSAVTPFGLTIADFSRRMFAGESALRSLSELIDDPGLPVKSAGLLPAGFFPPSSEQRFTEEIEILLRGTLKELFSKKENSPPFDSVIYGTNEGLARFADIQKKARGDESSFAHLDPEFGLNVILARLSELGHKPLENSQTIICGGACTTGLAAVHYAAQRVRAGISKRVLVVCSESRLRIEEILKLNALGALSREAGDPAEASRPFSKNRSGFVRGEGAGAVIIENRTQAMERRASIEGVILGSAMTSDAWRLTDGREDLACAVRAVVKALKNSGVSTSEIDYINAHGTATVKNDLIETRVIKSVFGERAYSIPISSLKSQIGHLNFASGMVELIACLLMLREQKIAPTINYFEEDPDCDLDYVPNHSRPARLNTILKTGFGFGGSNAALVLRRI